MGNGNRFHYVIAIWKLQKTLLISLKCGIEDCSGILKILELDQMKYVKRVCAKKRAHYSRKGTTEFQVFFKGGGLAKCQNC